MERASGRAWANKQLASSRIHKIGKADPTVLREIADIVGVPTQGRTSAQIAKALQAYKNPAKYSRRLAEEAAWTDERIKFLVDDLAYWQDDKTKAWAGVVNPRDFVRATAGRAMIERLDAKAKPLDREAIATEGQTPFLSVKQDDAGRWFVSGHEGRHRMHALALEGVTSVPVVLRTDTPAVRAPMDSLRLGGQRGIGPAGDTEGVAVVVSGLVPLARNRVDELREKFGGDAAVRFSRRDTLPPNIPLTAPQVEARVTRLGEAESRAIDEGVLPKPTSLKRDKTQTWGSLDQEIREKSYEWDDEKIARLANKKGRVLSAAEQQTVAARVELRKEEMHEKSRARAEAARMSAAERTAAGLDLDTLVRDEMDSTLAYIAVERASVNAGTEAARALAARRRIMEAGPESSPDMLMRKLIGELPGVDDTRIEELFNLYRDGKHREFTDRIRDAIRPTWAQKLVEYWRGALLTGIPTHVANFTGNVTEPVNRLLETMAAAGIDKALAAAYGGDRERFLGEWKYELQGQFDAVPTALERLGADFLDQIVHQNEPNPDMSRKFEHQVGAIGGRTGRLVRTSFRALGISDDYFKAVGGEGALRKLAYREALKEGFRGEEAATRAARIAQEARSLSDPRWRSLMEKVAQERLERTFQEDPVKFIQSVSRLTREHPLAGMVIPFVRTPSNITKVAWQRSAMGLLLPGRAQSMLKQFHAQQKAEKEGRPVDEAQRISRGEVADALARPVVGTILMSVFGTLAMAGLMTGSGPTDEEERKALQDTGWQPYSLKIPIGKGRYAYIPYTRFEPVSAIMGIMADAVEAGDASDVSKKILGSVAQNYTNKTFWRGIMDAGRAIMDPDKYLKGTVASYAGSLLVPTLIAKGAEAIDPVLRERRSQSGIEGTGEAMVRGVGRRIPGVSRGMEPIYTPLGGEAQRGGNVVTRFVLPVQYTTTRAGKEVESYLVRIGAVPAEIPRALQVPQALMPPGATKQVRIDLSNEERAFLAQARRDAAETLRKRLPALERLPIETQVKRAEEIFREASTKANKKLWVKYPDLRERARERAKKSL